MILMSIDKMKRSISNKKLSEDIYFVNRYMYVFRSVLLFVKFFGYLKI